MHERRGAAQNHFRYGVCSFLIDLDELPSLDRAVFGFGYNRHAVVTFRDGDHIGDPKRPARENVENWLSERGVELAGGRVLLLTNLRVLGYLFNPVSFFYCYGATGELRAMIAEVSNTFGERRAYLLDARNRVSESRLAFRHPKELHVSPFFGMAQDYEFAFSEPGERLATRVDVFEEGRRVLRAVQTGTRRTLCSRTLIWSLIRYPVMPLRVSGLIHWQAAILWRKRVAFHRKPPFDPAQGSFSMTTTASRDAATGTPSGEPTRSRELRSLPRPRRTPAWKMVERAMLWALAEPNGGQLRIEMPGGSVHHLGTSGPEARVTIASRDMYHRILQRGRIGIGEGYQAGDWRTDDLPTAIEILARTAETVRKRAPIAQLATLYAKRPHLPAMNGQLRARQHIQYHYDLGNDLYALFLDEETWAYSCAIFDDVHESLADAQRNKFRRICEKLALSPGDHLLEIGCGWGGFAEFAAREYGARVTCVTLSDEQHRAAQERMERAGLSDRVTILLQDYRSLQGTFTKIASIEMFEAIGDREFGRFFATCDRLLAPNGWACVQTIAVPDQRYERYRRGHDWIREYIFPGAVIPSLTAIAKAMTEASELLVHHVEDIGFHYAETLKRWRLRFLENRDRVRDLGFDDRFVRTWEFYLAFCEAAFRSRALHDYQLVITRPYNDALPARTR